MAETAPAARSRNWSSVFKKAVLIGWTGGPTA
jgi:hypothetical protein